MTAPTACPTHAVLTGIPGAAGLAPGVSVIETPGHTGGTMSLRVELPEAGPGQAATLPFAHHGHFG